MSQLNAFGQRQSFTSDGFVQFVAIGGWWEHNLLSQRVEILTRSGAKILGVVASRPPHFLPEAQRRQVMTIDQMFIDVGAASRRSPSRYPLRVR